MVNIKAGEKMCYADLMLVRLLLADGVAVKHVWYDIGCRYGPHWRNHLKSLLPQLPAETRERAEDLLKLLPPEGVKFPLPPFHVHCHRWATRGWG